MKGNNRQIVAALIAALALLAALFGVLGTAPAAAQTEQREAVLQAATWLVEMHQHEDGGYTGFSSGAGGAPADVGGTVDAILGLATAGFDVTVPYPGREQTPIDYLQNNPEEVAAYAAQDGGTAGKLVLALVAAGQDATDFAGESPSLRLSEHLSPTGQYGPVSPFGQALAILAAQTAAGEVPESALTWLRERQAVEGEVAGSWDDGFGTTGNVDATAAAVMALAAAGTPVTDTALVAAADFLAQAQLESGGWPYAPGQPESANSTALAVQALSALGEDFASADGEWARDGVSPLAALLAWQGESGAFQADFGDGRFDDFFATVQALPAAAGHPFRFDQAAGPGHLPGDLSWPQTAAAATATAPPTETPPPTKTPPPATPTPAPTEVPATAVVEPSTATSTPTPSLVAADAEEVAQPVEETEATAPIVAWVLVALAALLVVAVAVWVYVRPR